MTGSDQQQLQHLRGEARAIIRDLQACGFRRPYEAEPLSVYVRAYLGAPPPSKCAIREGRGTASSIPRYHPGDSTGRPCPAHPAGCARDERDARVGHPVVSDQRSSRHGGSVISGVREDSLGRSEVPGSSPGGATERHVAQQESTGMTAYGGSGRQSIRSAWGVGTRLAICLSLLLTGAAYGQANCIPDGGPCAATARSCCPPDVYSDPAQKSGCRCVAPSGSTTTTAATSTTAAGATTTTSLGMTTTTVAPQNDAGLRFTPADLAPAPGQPAAASAPIFDPRTGAQTFEQVRWVMQWQYMQACARIAAAAQAAGVTPNIQDLLNACNKFGMNYVEQHAVGAVQLHGRYLSLDPSYVRQYVLEALVNIAQRLEAAGQLTPYLGQLSGFSPGPRSQAVAPAAGDLEVSEINYDPGHYPPLNQQQCEALAHFADLHHRHGQALANRDPNVASLGEEQAAAGLAFEQSCGTSRSLAALCVEVHNPEVDPYLYTVSADDGVSLADHMNARNMMAFQSWADGFNCASGLPPDATKIVEALEYHFELHFCGAQHLFLDIPLRGACVQQKSSCLTLTCRQLATIVP